MNRDLLIPFVLHFALILALYAALTLARARAVKRGEVDYSAFRRADGDPPAVAPIARNLANQFELPPLAWFAATLLVISGSVAALDVAAAWMFLVGRVAHTAVQTLTGDVRLRGVVFTINFLAVVWLAAHAALVVLAGGFS